MKRPLPAPHSGVTFVEFLVALVIGAAIIAAAVIGFGTIAQSPTRGGRIDVTLPGTTHNAFFGTPASYVTIGQNPNYFQAAQARRMKDRLMADVSASSAVFVLGRNGGSSIRPSSLTVPADFDFRNVSTPADFAEFLGEALPAAASVFNPAQQSGALNTTNATIFLLTGLRSVSQGANTIFLISTYEMDFVPTTSPAGVYASVRRYSSDPAVPTDYYQVFYPDESNTSNAFRPLAAFFERQAMGTGSIFGVAPNHPFSFVWWPDPLVSYLSGRPVQSGTVGTPRASYANMAGRTSLFMVLPTFPSL